ncbi:CHU large protein [Fulvivirga imtechensis AK7]|uniref:CHU large protein n=1 Tax=Fulvivirga imtechensis AK7 TaxID=1237149 RepID=L8JX04_9BACT|nr:T9SS C-terminal target domain-containing protein [Fulvivirga imtechensis]ELR72159.1 CHU large protein [Fulvivirga imtechensis AK7]
MSFKTNLTANVGSKVHLAFLIMLMSYSVHGQSCDCPASDSCGPCSGGLSSLTLRYNGGGLIINVLALDGRGTVGISFLNDIITLESEAPEVPFNGDVTVTAIVLLHPGAIHDSAVIDISCTSPINVGDVYGNFSVVAGVSVEGIALCCTASAIETNPPQISNCPADIHIAANSITCDVMVNWEEPVAVDDCQLVDFTSTFNPGSSFPLGTTEVAYTATDKFGNTSTCSFFVVVNDETPPVFQTCHSSITAYTSGQSCTGAAFWTIPSAVDNCSAVQVAGNYSSGDTFPFGVTTVTYTANDEAGNTSICTFIVQVKDTLAPVFSGCLVSDIVVSAATSCEAVAFWTPPQVNDDCTFALTSNYNPGDIFPLGATSVAYTAIDASGNTAICSFDVVVVDSGPPEFLECPADIIVIANSTCLAEVHWNVPIVADACSGVVATTASHEPGNILPVGITQVSYTATDEVGNSGSCYFDVIVQNEQLPLISGCPADIDAKAGESGQVEISWKEPLAQVSCGTVTLESSHLPGELFPVGVTEVEYTAMDNAGQVSSCRFNVTVAYEELKFDVAPLITPDGDGKNDLWLLSNIEKFKDNKVIIVDRWGGEIYRATGYNNENIVWDGNNMNGVPVPTGTYFYFISVKFVSEKVEKKGFIELVR